MAEQNESNEDAEYQKIKGWVDYPRDRVIELNKIAKEKGYDPGKIVLGFAIDVIIYDDANAFGPTLLNFNELYSNLSRRQYQDRVDWELTVSELPQDIKDHITGVKGELAGLDWKSEEGFKVIYKTWKEKVQTWMNNYYETHPDVKEALKYYLEFEDRVRKDNLASTPTESFLK